MSASPLPWRAPRQNRLIAGLLVPAILLWGVLLAMAQPSKQTRDQIEAGRLTITQIEAALKRDSLDDARLTELRSQTDPVLAMIEAIILREQPRADEIKARIDKLGPAPDAAKGASESEDVARDRAEQQKHWKEADESLRLARALALRAEQVREAIAGRRLQIFTRETFKRTESVASPKLWIDVIKAIPADFRALRFLTTQLSEAVLANLDWYEIVILAMLAGLLLYGAPRAWHWVRSGSLSARKNAEDLVEIPRLTKALIAVRMVVLNLVLPAVVLVLLQLLLKSFGLVPPRVEPILDAFFRALAIVFGIGGIALAVLSPGRPELRLFEIPTPMAREFWHLLRLLALLAACEMTLEAVHKAIVASLPLTVMTKGVFAALMGASIMRGMQRAFASAEPVDKDATTGLPGWLSSLRMGGWAIALVIFLAALAGYVALGAFLALQVLWVAALGLAATLMLVLIDEFLGVGLSAGGVLGQRIHLTTGIKRSALDQFGVLGSGLARLVLFVVLGFLILAPWGLDSSNFLGSLRTAFFGFQVGGVTISLASIAIALALLVGGFLITGMIKNWLEKKFLPHTELDVGLRNSIGTIFGYIGTFITIIVALSHLGFSVEKLTIVAGALSVGIGFGLQSIVSNFVSGLILLWERPIRVGDFIVVGDEQGIVKRINVRATEIETFDRASLIVPNSEFISGRVKNWMHSDRSARILIPVNVDYKSDPEEVAEILRAAALAHIEVLSTPKPIVFFKNLGESGLDFELFCHVDVDARGTVRSELLFDIFRRLKAANIEIPYPTRRLEITNIAEAAAAMPAREGGK